MKTIVVVGDTLLDTDISGSARRLSPDAPVPVVDVGDVGRRAGGAGLVARMLEREGRQVHLVTVLSDDGASGLLRTALAGIPLTSGPSDAPTPVKTRIRAGGQAVVRFDEGCTPAPVPAVTTQMLAAVAAADAVLVSDYGRGLTANPALRELLGAEGRAPGVERDADVSRRLVPDEVREHGDEAVHRVGRLTARRRELVDGEREERSEGHGVAGCGGRDPDRHPGSGDHHHRQRTGHPPGADRRLRTDP